MIDTEIPNPAGKPFNAKIEVDDGSIIFHSRSGAGAAARNPDYRPALETILARLAENGIKPDVYLDSRPAQALPLAQRRLATGAQLSGTAHEQFNFLIRAMNAGTDSHGAWRRIMLSVPNMPTESLVSILQSPALAEANSNDKRPLSRLTASEQRRVDNSHVTAAVKHLLAGHEMQQFAESRDYDVVTPAGDRLAPKKVFGLALELTGVVPKAMPQHFSAGWGQPSFELLEAAGYSILPKVEAAEEAARRKQRTEKSNADVDRIVATIGADNEERSWIEGDTRMASHLRIERKRDAKAAAAKRAAVRSDNAGRLACERCETDWYSVYPTVIADAIFDIHHTIPLAQMDAGHATMVEDLLCLCANCHRAEHRKMALGI